MCYLYLFGDRWRLRFRLAVIAGSNQSLFRRHLCQLAQRRDHRVAVALLLMVILAIMTQRILYLQIPAVGWICNGKWLSSPVFWA